MTLSSQYSTEQMYNEWINGTPISEIVKKTGIKRKTWNKRFERYEKQFKMATNNNLEVINGDKNVNDHVRRDNKQNKPQIISKNGATITANKSKASTLIAALAVISVMVAIYLIYMDLKKRKSTDVSITEDIGQ